jgi:hypothetical protein
MCFYRIELNSKGEVVLCTMVPCRGSEVEGNSVYVVEASSREQAIAIAFERYKEAQRKAIADRRARHAKEGRCRCGRERPEGRRQCQVCIDGAEASKARAQARARGEEVPKRSKAEAFATNRLEADTELILRTLERVHRAWCRSQTVPAFTAWLAGEIDLTRRALQKITNKEPENGHENTVRVQNM